MGCVRKLKKFTKLFIKAKKDEKKRYLKDYLSQQVVTISSK